MQSPVSASSDVGTFEVTSADEASALTRATEILQIDTFIATALQGLRTAEPVIARFAEFSKLASTIALRASGNFVPVTVSAFERLEKSESGLREFFNNDGPILGNNLDEANKNYSDLNLAGVVIDAPIEVPVLVEIDRKDGKGIIKSLGWIAIENSDDYSKFPELQNTRYPGSREFLNIVKDSKGKVIEETRYTVFKDYANRRTSLASLSEALGSIAEKLAEIAKQVLLELQFVKNIAIQVEKNIISFEAYEKNESMLVDKITSAATEFFEANLRLRAFLHRERQLLIIRQESRETKVEHQKMHREEIKILRYESDKDVSSLKSNDFSKMGDDSLMQVDNELKNNLLDSLSRTEGQLGDSKNKNSNVEEKQVALVNPGHFSGNYKYL